MTILNSPRVPSFFTLGFGPPLSGSSQRGGKREGAGRKPEGKERFTVTLTADNVTKAKAAEGNFSGLLDRLLADWLAEGASPRK